MTPGPADTPGGTTGALAADGRPAWIARVTLVTIVAAVAVMAAAMARPMVTYRALGLGASPLEIGIVQAAYSVLPMLMAITLGRWVDRVGEPRVLVLGCVTLIAGAIGLALADGLWVLTAGQVAMGFGVIAAAIASQSFVANHGPADRAVHRFGWFSVAISVGQIVGPLLAAWLVVSGDGRTVVSPSMAGGETMVFLASAAISLVALGLIRFLPRWVAPERPADQPADGGARSAALRMLRSPGIAPAMFVSLAVSSGIDVLIVYLPAYGEETGLGVSIVGTLLAVRAGATLISRAFMGRMTDRLGFGPTLVLTTATAALSVALVAVVTAVPALVVLVALTGFGLGIGQPLTVAWIGLRTAPHERGLAFGVRHTGNLATLVAMPVVMGLVAGATGLAAVWIVLGGFLGVAALVAARTPFRLG